jgi:hypothetical protein
MDSLNGKLLAKCGLNNCPWRRRLQYSKPLPPMNSRRMEVGGTWSGKLKIFAGTPPMLTGRLARKPGDEELPGSGYEGLGVGHVKGIGKPVRLGRVGDHLQGEGASGEDRAARAVADDGKAGRAGERSFRDKDRNRPKGPMSVPKVVTRGRTPPKPGDGRFSSSYDHGDTCFARPAREYQPFRGGGSS